MDGISIDTSDKTSDFVSSVRERESDILPELIRSKPDKALNLITLVTEFDIWFNCNFTQIISRLERIEKYIEICDEKVIVAKFYYNFGEILTKVSRFDCAMHILEKAEIILRSVTSDRKVILDLLSVKVLLGRCQLLSLRNGVTDQLEEANQLIKEYTDSSGYEPELIYFKKVEVLVLTAEIELKMCNYRAAEHLSRRAHTLLTETSLQRNWNTYILEAKCARLLGDSLINLSCFEESKVWISQSLELFGNYLKGDDHQEIAKCYVRLGDLNCLMGNSTYGLDLHLHALNMRQRIFCDKRANAEVAASLNRVGYAYHLIGKYKEASEYFEKARAMRTEVYSHCRHITTLYISYPSCLYSGKAMVEAGVEYDQFKANSSLQDQATKPHLANASADHRRGDIWFALKHWDLALHSYEAALRIRQEIDSQSLAVAVSYYAIGKCYIAINRLEDAKISFSKANQLRNSLLIDDKEIDLQLAVVYLKQKKFDVAMQHLKTAFDKCDSYCIKLSAVRRKFRTEGMSDNEIDCVVNMIWSIPAEPFSLI
jgi:tetratricopeptide (TPR) repeat protein